MFKNSPAICRIPMSLPCSISTRTHVTIDPVSEFLTGESLLLCTLDLSLALPMSLEIRRVVYTCRPALDDTALAAVPENSCRFCRLRWLTGLPKPSLVIGLEVVCSGLKTVNKLTSFEIPWAEFWWVLASPLSWHIPALCIFVVNCSDAMFQWMH